MSDKEKFEAKKNGQDIDEGVATVLQNTDWAKEKSQEETSVEASAPIESDKPISEVIPTDNKETVEEAKQAEEPPVFEQKEDTPFIAPPILETQNEQKDLSTEIDFDKIAASLTSSNVDEVNQVNNDISTSGNFDFGSVGTFETQTPAYEEPQMFNNSSMDTQMNNYSNISNDTDKVTSNSELFSNSYDDVINGTKTIAAVVTEQDELNAKSANMNAYEKLYDAGPGKQISILRNFSGEAAKWIRAADKSGFVSGEMHDIAKKILREYEGLKEEQDEFTDDKIIPFNSNYNEQSSANQFNNFSGMNNNDNIVQFPGNNDGINNKPFVA